MHVLKDNFKMKMWLRRFLRKWVKLNFNSSYVLLLNYIFNGIILKRKEILIQWRKFGFKRSCIFKVMNFWSYALFQILIWFFNEFLSVFCHYKIAKSGVLSAGPRGWRGAQGRAGLADVVRRTRADATWHARPRDRAVRAHVRRKWRTGRGHMTGGHTCPRGSTRTPMRGATLQEGWRVKGPPVSGPWWEY